MEDTIVAISTAYGNGGIGIVRLSGNQAHNILKKIFEPKEKDSIIKGYCIKYGKIIDNKTKQIVDEVLVSYFKSPKSYTKEDMCEINTHGGIVIEKQILKLCIDCGARLAEPGEFTKRAFLNGRIDLAEAESVMNLINSKTEKQAKESINQLEGKLSKKIIEINQKLLDLLVLIDVNIDYPEYDDVEQVTKEKALNNFNEIIKMIEKLENSFDKGKILNNGIKTVIIGKPNSGKSSLLNYLLNEDRAIVSEIKGTTRDTIEESININGILLNLVDTAGIRSTENEIEKIGISKSMKMAKDADLIIAIFDISTELDDEDKKIVDIIKNKNSIILLNKSDLIEENIQLEKYINKSQKNIIKVSIKNENGLDNLLKRIEDMYNLNEIENKDEVIITNERHKIQIEKAKKSALLAIETIENDMPIDIVTIYINECLESLDEILGTNVNEEVINQIFKNFCLGK